MEILEKDIKWKTFPDDKYNPMEIHVCPCDIDGNILVNHILDMTCPCNPEKHVDRNGILYIHNVIVFN